MVIDVIARVAVRCLLLFDFVAANTINVLTTTADHFLAKKHHLAFSDPIVYGYTLERQGQSPCVILQTTRHRSAVDASGEGRREFVSSTVFTALTISFPRTTDADETLIPYRRLTTPRKIAQYIYKSCNSFFLSSVIKSDYNFLYRGLSPEESEAVAYSNYQTAIIVKDDPYDLLDADTYKSEKAAAYFEDIESEMSAKRMPLTPSNSHLATTCPMAAAKWGKAASIWPLGELGVEFAWMADGGLFWNSVESGYGGDMRKILVSDGKSTGLTNALQGDSWEIMFRADSGFVAVSAELDDELRAHLRKLRK